MYSQAVSKLNRLTNIGVGQLLIRTGWAAGRLFVTSLKYHYQSTPVLLSPKLYLMRKIYLSSKNFVSALALVWLLLGIVSLGKAQVYYTLSDGMFSTTGDQLRQVGLNGSGDVQIATGFVSTPGTVAIDAANNQAFVAQTPGSAPAILRVNLTSGASTSFLSFTTNIIPSGLAVDRVNNFLYYTIGDGAPGTLGDQLRRIKLDGTGDEQVATGFAEVIGNIALDLANDRVFVIDTRIATDVSSQIFAVNLTTKVATIFKSSALAIRGLAVDRANSTLYYIVDDGSFMTATDELRKINLNGSGDASVATGFVNSPGSLVVDPVNNRVLVADLRANTPRILAVNIATNAATVFFTPPGTGTFTLTGIAIVEQAPTVTTTVASAIASTSATLGGNVTAAGSSAVTNRGVVYSSSNMTPAIGSGTQMPIGSGTGTFSQSVTGLMASTTYYVRAYAINAAGTAYGAVQTFTTLTPNNAPTDITLSAASVAENQPVSTSVGNFSTTDADAGQTFSYSLVSGTGSTDNASFQIVGNQLRTVAVFNFEVKNSYTIRVQTTDNGVPALTFQKSFTISVTNVNEAPTVANTIPPQSATVGQNFTYVIPANTFTDPETPGSLNLTVAGLPAGLTFMAPATISGTPSTTVGSPFSVTVTATDPGSLSVSTTFSLSVNASAPMPVRLVRFVAQRLASGGVGLDWETSLEQNTAWFDVQRSWNALEFGNLGRVQATGESTQTQRYAFLDEATPAQTVYYRLRTVDKDGSFAYSSIVSVAVDKPVLLVTILGNPTRGKIQALVNSPLAQSLQISVLSASGREVYRQVARVSQGQTSIEINTANLTAGLYQFVVSDGSDRHVKRVLIE